MKGWVTKGGLFAIAIAAISGTGVAVSASAEERAARFVVPQSSPPPTSWQRERSDDFVARRILDSHNVERSRLGLSSLKWNRHLEAEAGQWARELSRRGRLEHASHSLRKGTGENLWMGSAGVWDVETMVGMFLEEKRHYRHDNFPNISRTGNWADVGHYSQIVWRDTREVGCAVHTDRGNDVLVCRYWPAGNVWGARAY